MLRPRPGTPLPGSRNLSPAGAGTVLAFDFGERRIGVAVGETGIGIAHPLETIDAEANDVRFTRIAELVEAWRPGIFVVGLPLSLDGGEHRLTALARKFAARLTGRFEIQTRLIDERLTSAAAEIDARAGGMKAKDIPRHVDKLAAQMILEAYFSEHHAAA
jgi:putative Holliday junction resolvase